MLKELFERVLKEYKSAHNENFVGHTIANILRNEIPEALRQIIENSNKYKVSGSAGQGNWTYSPWVAIMNREITETPQKGYYLVYLFREDMSGVYLSFNQGMTEIKNQNGSNKTKEILRSKAIEFREKLGEYPKLLDSIDLRPINSSSNSVFYEEGNVYAKYYDLENLPSDDIFIKDLRMFLELYDSIVDDNMDLEIIKDQNEIEKAQNQFLEVIKSYGDKTVWGKAGFQGGHEEGEMHWSNELGIWLSSRKLDTRYWNGFGIQEPENNQGYNITCEINFPIKDIKRGIAGAFAKDNLGNIYVIHRGIIGGNYNKKIFEERYNGDWTTVKDGDKESKVVLIGKLNDPKFVFNIRDFVLEVNRIKNGQNSNNLDFNVYWVTVGKNLQGNYRIGIENGIWAVKDNYVNKLENVKLGDYVLFYGNSIGFSLCKVEKEHFLDNSKIWLDDIYPNRIKISKPIFEGSLSTEDIRDCITDANNNSYNSVRAWASSIRGGGGVFRKLKDDESNCLFKKLNWEFPPKEIEIEFGSFTDFLSAKGYYFEPETIENFLLSLKVKPFVILTGNSGTGKTKIAQLFCEYLSFKNGECHKIIPVGANWTENRHVLGFYNVITKEYMKSDALELILEARKEKNKDKPFFLILDEMNLSHVERYFADFLSAMESGEKIPLHKSNDEENKKEGIKIPKNIKIPENLFVIGTVNVDETTYMFSPKVLDRANVIEFSTSSAKNYMLNGFHQEELKGNVEYIENPLSNIRLRKERIGDMREYMGDVNTQDGEKVWNLLSEELNKFQETLKKAGFDFGFRVIDEILRFMYVAWVYHDEREDWDWQRYFDAQIKQKMLPKIHGSQRTLETVLIELFEHCCFEKSEKSPRNFGDMLSNEDICYHSSALKLQEMDKVLYEQRYVAFIN
ncbi:MrcB family domain-containing protein [Methanobacterium sp.]|uniref:MrcB family domain-containing protein n=1 Tax=Methanobacterium sp. TaxID=2164 RepID=UPI003C75004F